MAETDEVAAGPINSQNWLFKLLLPKGLAGLALPNNYQAGVVPTGNVSSVRAGGQRYDRVFMADKGDIERGGEGTQSRRVWELRNHRFRVNIELFLLDSGTEVEVQTSLETLLNKLIVDRNVSHFIESRGDKVERSVFLVHLLPLLQLLLCQQILLGGMVRLVMSWQLLLHWSNADDSPINCCSAGPGIIQLLFFLLLLILVPLNPT